MASDDLVEAEIQRLRGEIATLKQEIAEAQQARFGCPSIPDELTLVEGVRAQTATITRLEAEIETLRQQHTRMLMLAKTMALDDLLATMNEPDAEAQKLLRTFAALAVLRRANVGLEATITRLEAEIETLKVRPRGSGATATTTVNAPRCL